MSMQASQEIRNIVAQVIGESEVSLDTSIQTSSHWDSMAHVQILVNIEKKFNLRLPIEDIAEVESVAHWIELVNKHLEKRSVSG